MKLISQHDEPVQIAITDAQILFSFGTAASPGRAVLVSNLVEGSFPPYEDVIPKDQDKKVTFDRDVLASAVRRAALLTNEESRGVRMNFKGKDKLLELSSRAAEVGEAQIRCDLAGYEGDDVEIGFNPTFVTDALKVISEPEVIAAIATDLGIDGKTLLAGTQEQAVKDRLKALVDEAIVRGVFGAPYVFVDGEPFWGNDRLPQIERWLQYGPF
jgi:hypothetical protein